MRSYASLLFSFVFAVPAVAADPLPLSPEYWKDPAFLRSFNGTYQIEARIEPSVSTEERALLLQVQERMAQSDRSGALRLVRESSLLSGSAALQFNLGNVLFEEGNLAEAIKAYEEAIKKYPSFRRAHRNLAMALMRESKVPEALPSLLEAIRLGDQDGVTYGLLGYCRLQEEKWASALQAYRMALLVEPDSIDWKTGLAQCLQHLDQSEEAVALLDEVIAARPDQPSYAMLQATLLLSLDRPEDAVEALELPRRLRTLDGEGLLLLAELHLRAGREPVSIPAIQEAFTRQPLPSRDRILGTLRSAVNLRAWKLAHELETRARAAAEGENNAPYLAALKREQARIDLGSGEAVERGVKSLRELIAARPDDGQALLILGRHLAAHEAREEAEMLLERSAKTDETAFDAWFEITRIRVDQRRYAAAVESADKALELRESEDLARYREALVSLTEASQ